MKCAVLYISRADNTRKLAEMLHPNDEDLKRLDKFIMQILYERS